MYRSFFIWALNNPIVFYPSLNAVFNLGLCHILYIPTDDRKIRYTRTREAVD